MNNDLRLIEDYLPIQAISAEASREKSVRKGHVSTLHLWWARRPLVACRAAVYGALVPADRWFNGELPAHNVANGDAAKIEKWKNGTKKGLNRRAAKNFVTKLCRYPKTDPTNKDDIKLKNETEAAIIEAQKHILEAHADRLTAELAQAKTTDKPPAWVEEFKFKGDKVGYADIVAGRAPRPRVLDMFAGGGAIPLEALRLGCEAYALDLNPVAHIIQLCTLVYPQKYGKPDPAARGMTGPKNAQGETTWGGLADEVRHWGNWVLEKVRKEIGDLYPLIPDPEFKKRKLVDEDNTDRRKGAGGKQQVLAAQSASDDADNEPEAKVDVQPGFLMPVAYLWTRTVRCKNPACAASVPLVKQTWLCKKDNRYAAMRVIAPKGKKQVRFEVVECAAEKSLGFDPEAFSKGGNATCPFCGTVADSDYVKSEGCAERMGTQLMAVACNRPSHQGKVYLSAESVPGSILDDDSVRARIVNLCKRTGIAVPSELIIDDAKNSFWIRLYGFTTYGHLFTPRQMFALLSFCAAVQEVANAVSVQPGHLQATSTLLAAMVDKLADFDSTQCTWNYTGGRGVGHSFTRQAIPMAWDFAETNPFNPAGASWVAILEDIPAAIDMLANSGLPADVERRSATGIGRLDESIDAVITDPPYYDNVSYADLSDFFFVWLKRSVGHLYPEHFSGQGTPKKNEAVSDAARHSGSQTRAKEVYEELMSQAFAEAVRVLKPGGSITIVYAHKTTLGWSTLVDALRRSGCEVVEAWPLDTERGARMIAMGTAALASSIFLIARKRKGSSGIGNYEDDVQPELQQIAHERVETLWEMGIAGADLVIACVGAGLRAFTKYEKVEYANGEEVLAEKFLAEVEGVVLDAMLAKLSGVAGGNVSAIDNASRFYVLWRFVYKTAELDAGEVIIFANGTHIELDGPHGLSSGSDALIEKKKAKYRARDFTERGDQARLGLPDDEGRPASLIDVLHRVLWLMDNSPRKLGEFLADARPDRERLRALAQALAGAALSGKSEEEAAKLVSTTPAEQAALGKLLANWRNLIELGAAVAVVGKKAAKDEGQATLEFGNER